MTHFVSFVGYDAREDVAYQVCKYTLEKYNDTVVVPLIQDQLRAEGIYTREKDKRASTDFSLTRYLVPYLKNYEGYSVFCDCDFVFTNTLHTLLARLKGVGFEWSVALVKHNYRPHTEDKMDDCRQYVYPKKNWSSFMVFNNRNCKALTQDYVNTASPSDLHQFKWTDERDIIPIDFTYNFLVGEYEVAEGTPPIGIHYTLGGPWFEDVPCHDYFDVWNKYHKEWTDEKRKVQR